MQLKPVHDPVAGCYRVTAPDGWRLGPGLHEIISDYEPNWPGDRRTAYLNALQDCRDADRLLEPCTDPDCEWCNEQED